MTPLTKTQAEVLRRLQAEPAATRRLARYSGGFWTIPSTPTARHGVPIGLLGHFDPMQNGAPTWSVTIGTLRALERLGVLCRAREADEEWRDARVLTPSFEPAAPEEDVVNLDALDQDWLRRPVKES